MLAGNMYRNAYNDSNPADKAVSYVCLNYQGNSSQTNEFPTDKNCPDGLRAQIVFPSCWDGKNLDSDDHQSHMSYPVGGAPDNGDCPPDHPIKVRIPAIYSLDLRMNPFQGSNHVARVDILCWRLPLHTRKEELG